MNSPYLQEFNNEEDIITQYEAGKDALKGAKVLLAWYGYGDYCGGSLVIYKKDGKLYEVNGSHCSCNGLEGQWEPEETSWEALAMRKFYGSYDGANEAQEILNELVSKNLKKSKKGK